MFQLSVQTTAQGFELSLMHVQATEQSGTGGQPVVPSPGDAHAADQATTASPPSDQPANGAAPPAARDQYSLEVYQVSVQTSAEGYALQMTDLQATAQTSTGSQPVVPPTGQTQGAGQTSPPQPSTQPTAPPSAAVLGADPAPPPSSTTAAVSPAEAQATNGVGPSSDQQAPGSASTQATLEGAARALGLPPSVLTAALQQGASLAQLAAQQGVTLDSVQQAMNDAAQQMLGDAVQRGTLTQDQASAGLRQVQAAISAFVHPEQSGATAPLETERSSLETIQLSRETTEHGYNVRLTGLAMLEQMGEAPTAVPPPTDAQATGQTSLFQMNYRFQQPPACRYQQQAAGLLNPGSLREWRRLAGDVTASASWHGFRSQSTVSDLPR